MARRKYLYTRRHSPKLKLGLGRRGRFSGIGTRPITGGYGTKRSKVRRKR